MFKLFFSYKNEIYSSLTHGETGQTEEMRFFKGFVWKCVPVLLFYSVINKDLI